MHSAYISGALTDISSDLRPVYLTFYELIGRLIDSLNIGLESYVPHLHTDPLKHPDLTPEQIDHIDRKAVKSSVILIAVADYPSHGVGIEVEIANREGVPVVLLCMRERLERRLISRLLRGNSAVTRVFVYEDFTDALNQLEDFIKPFMAKLAQAQSV